MSAALPQSPNALAGAATPGLPLAAGTPGAPAAPQAFDVPRSHPRVAGAPRLTAAQGELLREITVLDEYGEQRAIHIPAERPLTVFIDKRELVTLMTLGASPELLVLGYLLNQRLVTNVAEVESITVDWEVGAAAVKTHGGIADLAEKTARRVVTTGCGQGTVFGDAMSQLGGVRLPSAASARIRQSTLHALLEQMRQRNSIHRKAGSVHGCALFQGNHGPQGHRTAVPAPPGGSTATWGGPALPNERPQGHRTAAPAPPGGSTATWGGPALPCELLMFVEDVGRHNAIDTIAGWMGLHGVAGGDKTFYTTGRLTSEMVMKAAQMGVPIIVSRNGVTAMGHGLAEQLGMTLFGRAANRHFLCYTGFERFDSEPEPQRAAVRVVAG